MLLRSPSNRRSFLKEAAFASAAAAFPILGCGSPLDTVLYVTVELGNPFYEDMISGLRKGLESHSKWQLQVRAGKAADDATGQLDAMQAFLVQHQNKRNVRLIGLVIVPAQSGPELCEMIRRYNTAGIPVINVDMPIDQAALSRSQAHVQTFIGSDNLEGGKAAATAMAEKLPKGGDVLVLLGAPGSLNARNRRDGFVSRLTEIGKERHLDFRIREWSCNWSATEASTATGTVLGGGKDLLGIFAANDEMALGAVQAVASANLGNRPKPLIVGYDATPDARKAIAAGQMYASISQNPGLEGQQSIDSLARVVANQPIPGREIIPVTPYLGKSSS